MAVIGGIVLAAAYCRLAEFTKTFLERRAVKDTVKRLTRSLRGRNNRLFIGAQHQPLCTHVECLIVFIDSLNENKPAFEAEREEL